MEKNYLTIKELSAYLKLPRETAYKYARNQKLPASKVGKHWRFERKEVDEWIANQRKRDYGGQILIVDDEEHIRTMFAKFLEPEGYDVHLVADGEEALDLLKHVQFDLVLLDLAMPKKDGVEVLREIKKMEVQPRVAIVTGNFEGDMMDQILEFSPVSILKKPIGKEELLNFVKNNVSITQ